MRPLSLTFLLLFSACRTKEPAPAVGTVIEVTGVLIDTHCYSDDPDHNAGRDHNRPEGHVLGCAEACARLGYPVGVLTEGQDRESKVWVLVTVPQILGSYMAETVRVTGEVRSDGVLIPHRIEWKEGAEWAFIL